MGRTLSRVQLLSWEDLMGIGRAAVVLCRVAFGIRRQTLPEILDGFHLRDNVSPAEDDRVERATQLIRWAHRLLPLEPNCIVDSLAAAALVRQQGFSVPLIIGVRRRDGALQAHAWLANSHPPNAHEFEILYTSCAKTALDRGWGKC